MAMHDEMGWPTNKVVLNKWLLSRAAIEFNWSSEVIGEINRMDGESLSFALLRLNRAWFNLKRDILGLNRRE